eukprot:scaffold3340_cov63-Phaeocystis_antarctica.AAC.3
MPVAAFEPFAQPLVRVYRLDRELEGVDVYVKRVHVHTIEVEADHLAHGRGVLHVAGLELDFPLCFLI